MEGQNAKTQEVEEQVGKRIAFVESLVNTSIANEAPSTVDDKVSDTPVETSSQQKEEKSERKTLRNNGRSCNPSVLILKMAFEAF